MTVELVFESEDPLEQALASYGEGAADDAVCLHLVEAGILKLGSLGGGQGFILACLNVRSLGSILAVDALSPTGCWIEKNTPKPIQKNCRTQVARTVRSNLLMGKGICRLVWNVFLLV